MFVAATYEDLVGICMQMVEMDREAAQKGNPIVKKTKALVRKLKRGKLPTWEGDAKRSKFVETGCGDIGYGNLGKETAYFGAVIKEAIKQQDANREERLPSEMMRRTMTLANTTLQLSSPAITMDVICPAGQLAMNIALPPIDTGVIRLDLRIGSDVSKPVRVPEVGDTVSDPIQLE